jgi:hypothetical protein
MSSPSSNNIEEDAWLMKIELKREQPKEALKEDKSKEATGDKAQIGGQALLEEGEEEDILHPYYNHLTPNEIEALGPLKWFVFKINISLMKIFCCKCKSSPSGASFVDWSTS